MTPQEDFDKAEITIRHALNKLSLAEGLGLLELIKFDVMLKAVESTEEEEND